MENSGFARCPGLDRICRNAVKPQFFALRANYTESALPPVAVICENESNEFAFRGSMIAAGFHGIPPRRSTCCNGIDFIGNFTAGTAFVVKKRKRQRSQSRPSLARVPLL